MEAALAAEARAADALRRAPPPTTKTPNARRLERLQLVAKYATTLHAGRAKASIVLDDPTIGAGRAALLWSQAPLAGVCDHASTLSQTCLHAARVARGDACVARVLNDDAITAARACLDRLHGDKNSTNFFEGLEAHARKEADILAKSTNQAEKILSRRLKGAFKVKLPTDCSQDSLRWAARLAIAIASELCADDTRVFLSSNFWAAGPGAAWRVWRDGLTHASRGASGRALSQIAAKAAASSKNAPGPASGALARACADAASALCRSSTNDAATLQALATCFSTHSNSNAQHAAAELALAARRARVSSNENTPWAQACLAAETAALEALQHPPDAAWSDETLGPGALLVGDALAQVFAGDVEKAFSRMDDMEENDEEKDGRDVLVRRALQGEGDGAVCAKATLLKITGEGSLRSALLTSEARAETNEGVQFALKGAAADPVCARKVLASLPENTSAVDVARLTAASLGSQPSTRDIKEALSKVNNDETAKACSEAVSSVRPVDAAAWLEHASTPSQLTCALDVVARTSSAGDEASNDRAITSLADGDGHLKVNIEKDSVRILKALGALSAYAASRGCPPDDLRRLGLRLKAPEAFEHLLEDLQVLADNFETMVGFPGAAARASLGDSLGSHISTIHEALKARIDQSRKNQDLKTLASATRILGVVACDDEPSPLRAWALSELARAWATSGLGSGAAYAQLRRPEVVSRLRALVFASKDLDDAQHAELACVVAETAKNTGAFEALSALVDHGQSVFVGSAPSVVAQAVAPSLVVRREVRTLEVLFASRRQLLEACLPRCLCATLLQIRSVAADAGNRLLSDVASLSAFASGEAISTPPAHRAKEDLLRAHADAVLVLLAAELGGDRAAAARDALDVIGHAVFGARASGVSRRKKGGSVDQALSSFVGRRFVHLVHAVVVHRAGVPWEKADRTERAARLRALASCAELLTPTDAATHAPKVLGILGAALDDTASGAEAETLAAVAVDALDRFASLLPDEALRAHLAAIVVAASPSSKKGVPRARCRRARDLLRRLLVERRDALESAICTIPTLPDTIDGVDTEQRPLRSELMRLAPLLDAEAPAVRVAAAEALSTTLSKRHEDLTKLMEHDEEIDVPPEVADVASALLRAAASLGASKEEASSERFRLAVATALGELGALDPTRLDVALHKTQDEAASRCSVAVGSSPTQDSDMLGPLRQEDVRAPPWGDDDEDATPSPRDKLVVAIVAEHLVSALHGDKVEDKAAYGIQELLRLLAGDDDEDSQESRRRQLPKWARKAFEQRNVHELVAPYASTDYVMKGKVKIKDKSDTNADRYGDDARQWAVRLAWDLCLRACSKTHAPVFRICRPMLTRCDSLAPFLLPYLVADVAITGGSAGEAFVARELRAAVEVGKDPVILQLVFDLRSTMESWKDACSRLELKHRKPPSHRGRIQKPFGLQCFTHETTNQTTEASPKFSSVLEALPHSRLADAAARAHADARAVLSYELDAKAQHEAWRKRQPKGKEYNDGADGWLPRLDPRSLERLQKAGARVAEDPDFLSGLAAVRRKAQFRATLSQDIREAETRGDWRRALDGYEHVLRAHEEVITDEDEDFPMDDGIKIHEGAAAIRASMPKQQAAQGLLQCLLELGHGESALLHADGFVARDPSLSQVVAPWQAEAAMSLGRWDKIPSSDISDSRVALAATVAALRSVSESPELFSEKAKSAKLAAMAGLGAASMESYGRAYPFVARLHAVREVEHAREYIKGGDLNELERRWDARRKAGAASSVPSWLSVRRRCLEVCGAPLKAGAACMEAATLARKAGRLTVARGDLRDAARLGIDSEALSLAEAKVARAAGQRGASRFGGHVQRSDAIATAANKAYALLEPVEANCHVIARRFGIQRVLDDCHGSMNILDVLDRNGPMRFDNSDERIPAAKRLLQATDCVVDARLRHGEEVIRRYELCVALRPDWARAYLSLARYFDLLATARESDVNKETDEVLHLYARRAMQWYARGLEHSAKHAQAALPRLVTTWFAYAALGPDETLPSTNDPNSLRRLQAHADKIIRRAAKHVPAAVWYGVMAQLISHAAHTRKQINTGVTQLLARIIQVHPDQALWTITYLATSTNDNRKRTGESLFELATTRLRKSAKQAQRDNQPAQKRDYEQSARTLQTAREVFTQFVRLARNMPVESRREVRLSKFVTAEQCQGLLVPARVALTPMPRMSSKGRWPTFPDRAPRISRLSDDVEVLRSKARPKKIALDASDGTRMRLLCKCEKAGDLRKDARVQDFNGVVNRLLDRDAASRRRGLRLRTFAVVILDEECGLLEWVPRTRKLKQVVDAAYRIVGKKMPVFHSEKVSGPFKRAQQQHRNDCVAMAKAYRQNVLSLYEPCTSRWFVSRFASDPAQWLSARGAFMKSCATWGAVGHCLGLGDRHGENILVDMDSGGCVHVDFDCLFDKGCALKEPEIVPFRLTPHMVEAFGTAGVDGAFRTSLQLTLGCLRDHKETLLHVLEPFLRDTTVAWERPGKAQIDDEPPTKRRRGEKQDAAATLRVVSRRLDGIYNLPVPPPPGSTQSRDARAAARGGCSAPDELPLSVPGQVERLIKESTSDLNLCRMYLGWTPFL